VSVDALALVRYGLRSAKDLRILDTVKVIDAILRKETRTGPVWHRYNLDGYGEHDDGSPFDGTGVGRGWPLLAGERAHYEIAKGNFDEAERLLHVIEAQASPGGLIPEQVWAHAEYIKLARSIRERKVFDMPPQPVIRYQTKRTSSKLAAWRFNQKIRTIQHGRNLRIEVLMPATIHWSSDGWKTVTDSKTVDTGLGIHYADLETATLLPGGNVAFTFFWPEANKWEGTDFQVVVAERPIATVQVES
jgi:glucoamylase